MSQSIITNAFEQLKAQQAANGSIIVLDKFVFANIPDLDVNLPISRDESWPEDAYIVHRQDVGRTGMVNANAVAYSAVLGADVGDFEFNWIGLVSSASDTVCMIVHAPLQKKIKTAAGQQGNVLTRSFLMEYSGASEQTQIITPVDTWQIDFTARLNGVDERIRIENIDTYGPASFLDAGFEVSLNGGVYSIKRGVGYVAGIRARLLADQELNVTQKPVKVWVDVCWRGTLISTWSDFTKIVVAETLDDYIENDEKHYVYAIAEIKADGSVTDLRPVSLTASLSAVSPQKNSIIYFDDEEKAKLTELSAFVRQMLNKASPGDVLNYLGLKDESQSGISDSSIEVQQPLEGGVIRTQHDKNQDVLTPYDFSSTEEMITAAVTGGERVAVFNSRTAFTLTVGARGDYPTLGQALSAAVAMRPLWKTGNDFCVIKLLTGYVHSEQLRFAAGVDLSWIKVSSEDAVVYTNTAAFTEVVRTYYEYKYMFYFTDSANSPVFAVQFEENRADSDVCAFIVTRRARLNFLPYSGGRKYYIGIHATYNAEVIAYHTGCASDSASVAQHMPAGYYVCDFSYCRYNALSLIDQVVCHMPISKFEHVTEFNQASVTCIYNTRANFHGSSASYSYIGWNIRDGSHVLLRDHKTIRCTSRGLTMIHTAFVDARRHDVEESDVATSGRVLDAATENGFYGCELGVRLDGAGFCDLAGNDMRNCGTAVNADTGAVISAKAIDVSGATVMAFNCQSGSTVAAPRVWAKNVAKLCELKFGSKMYGRWLNADSSITFETNTRFIDLRVGAEFHYSEAVISVDSGLIAEEGARLTLDTSTLKVRAVRSFQGGHVSLPDCNYDTAFNKNQPSNSTAKQQYIVSGGGIMNVTSCVNTDNSAKTYSTPKNAVSPGGIIFDVA